MSTEPGGAPAPGLESDGASPGSHAGSGAAPARGQPLGSAFWRLWTAATAASLGDGIRRIAFPLLAATLTRDPLLVSTVAAATTLPWLLIAPLAGAAVDRYDRLRLLWMTNAARAVVITVLAIALASSHASIHLLIAAALLVGAGETFVDDAAQALVPRTVAHHQLEVANSRLYGARVITEQFIGQGIIGVLFAAAVVLPFAADAAMLLLASIVSIALARRAARPSGPGATNHEPPQAGAPALSTLPVDGVRPDQDLAVHDSSPSAGAGLCSSIAEGARWLLTQPLLRSLWIMLAALGLGSGAFWGVIALYAFEVLDLGPPAIGAMLAVGATGSLIGSAAAPALKARLGAVGAMYLGLTLVTDALLGRVSAAFSMVAVGGASLGALGAGLIATVAGLPAVFWASAAVIATTALITGPTVLRHGDHEATAPTPDAT